MASHPIAHDLPPLRASLLASIEAGELVGASYTVMRRDGIVSAGCVGYADRENSLAMHQDHLFRIYSNTKLVTSCAILQLVERGKIKLDDPISKYLPSLASLTVLPPDAQTLNSAVATHEPIRISHLLTHTAGFTYAYREAGTLIGNAYTEADLANPDMDSERFISTLAHLPLIFQPGTAWNYSVATDVLGVLIEKVSGYSLDHYFQHNIFDPIGMVDTSFHVPADKAHRLAPMYVCDAQSQTLTKVESFPHSGAYVTPQVRLSGGGGLVSSLQDFSKLIITLLQGGHPLLSPEMVRLMTENQLPKGMWIGKPTVRGQGHSFAASVIVEENPAFPASFVGDVQWGGVGGTHWFFSPKDDLGVVLMTQRFMGYGLPFWQRFKQAVRDTV